MGDSLRRNNASNMKFLVVVLLAVTALTYASYETEQSDAWDMDEALPENMPSSAQKPVKSLMDAVKKLHKHAPTQLKEHVKVMAHHASMIQDTKAKAYVHNLKSAKAAINAALRSLNGELLAGHRHDTALLRNAKRRGVSTVANASNGGKNKVSSFKKKSCPKKRAEEGAARRKRAAKQAESRLEQSKTCPLGTTMAQMNVHKTSPILGTELRKKWYRKKAQWNKLHAAYNRAIAAHKKAVIAVNRAMASFRTSLRIEASNTNRQCRNAVAEFNVLKRDVASNVKTRKQVHISALVVKCYVNNISSNSRAQSCASRAQRANTSIWNINGGSLPACKSKASLTSSFGPSGWNPSSGNCRRARL